jgi:hypothetical protein
MKLLKLSKSMVMGIGGVVVVAGVFATALTLIAPRVAHAAAAAIVQVANTIANPAVTQDTSRAASQIIHLTTNGKAVVSPATMTQLRQYITGGTFGPPYVVPTGENLVITSIEVSVSTAGGSYLNLYDNTTTGQREYWYLPNPGLTQLQFPSGLVFPAGTPVYVYIGGTSQSPMVVDMHGYLTVN